MATQQEIIEALRDVVNRYIDECEDAYTNPLEGLGEDSEAVRLYKDAKAAVALLSDLDWQPMETAPRDGTEVLLLLKNYTRCVAHWLPGGHCIEDHPPIDKGWYYWCGTMFRQTDEPRKWMKLPATS